MAAEAMETEEMALNENAVNAMTDRMSRAAGALGMKLLNNLRGLNCLIIGCRGVGIETAKNLILTGPNSVLMWDREVVRIQDMGANFYLQNSDVGQVARADAALQECEGLNPYCQVQSFQGTFDDIMGDLLEKDTENDADALGCVIVTELLPKDDLIALNEKCRAQGITFILGLNSGVTASVFSDFGSHSITDKDGEPTETFAVHNLEVIERGPLLDVQGVDEGEPMVVVTISDPKHGFDDNDWIKLEDLSGNLAVLNDLPGVQCKRIYYKTPADDELQKELAEKSFQTLITKNPLADVYNFIAKKKEVFAEVTSMRTKQMFNRFVLDLSQCEIALEPAVFEQWSQGGLVTQMKKPFAIEHASLADTLVCPPGRCNGLPLVTPQHMSQESWEAGVATDIHIFWAAVMDFETKNGRYPNLHDNDDAQAFFDMCQGINKERQDMEEACFAGTWNWNTFAAEKRDVDEIRAKRFARYFCTELTGLCAFLGGVLAQEVMKRFGKYSPISQWLHYDDQNLITDESDANLGPLMNTRYDWQIAVLGKEFQAKLADQKIFLVGCGALGCEYLKGLALMGVATGSRGKVWVTDMDRIEVSNLSRQFLFRQEMVGKPKSTCGAKVVQDWNGAFNIESLEMFVGPKTEDYFDDIFWENLDLCWNALDNVQARKYTDSRCLFFSKPLLESGTLGTKCNGEIILPFRTKSYNDSVETDDNEKQIAMCTLKNFPYLPIHCIEYAKQSSFSEYFEDEPQKYESFRNDLGGFMDTITKEGLSTRVQILKRMKRLVEAQANGISMEMCILLAFNQMCVDYRNQILDLLYSYPEDAKKQNGSAFWSGTKRFPTALDFNYDNELAMQYLYCSANLYAFSFGIDYVRDANDFMNICQGLGLQNPEYSPQKVEDEEEEEDDNKEEDAMVVEDEEPEVGEDDLAALEELANWASSLDMGTITPLVAHDFEKDDDTNFHIDYLTCATNMRSENYSIKHSSRLEVKLIAGRIIPALATTTAMVCGLTELEFCKLVLGLSSQGNTKFRNSNINLGTATFNVFEPEDPVKFEMGLPKNYTTWDKITLDVGNLTCGEFVQNMKNSFPGLDFGFVVNPKATKEQNPCVIECAQVTIGQDALGLAEDEMPPSIFSRFPAARMAIQQLKKPSLSENLKARFEKMLVGPKEYIETGKTLASSNLYERFVSMYGEPLPLASGEQKNYVMLEVQDAKDSEFNEVTLPQIKYVFSH